MKRVLVFGTFDILHPGHTSFLRQARRRGDTLVAAVARDVFVSSFKGKPLRHAETERRRNLLASGLVDQAYLGDRRPGSYAIVKRLRPDVICFGHDQHLLEADLRAWMARSGEHIELYRLRSYRPDIYKSSKLEKAALSGSRRPRAPEAGKRPGRASTP
jgi:FAD synthetase